MTRSTTKIKSRKFRVFGRADLDRIPQLETLSADDRLAMKAVANVLPFRVNEYVVDELIDWDAVPADSIFQLSFPQPGMLDEPDLRRMKDLVARGADRETIDRAARQIQRRLNPHPAGQMELNVPRLEGEALPGMQHKYRDTVLFFPSPGQTCHTYCTYCFRWPQFVGIDDLKFAARQSATLVGYLKQHPEVSNVLITGGDPLTMRTSVLRRFIEPLLVPELEHISVIRIGTKSPAWWPYRFLSDPDADDLLRLFGEVRASGRHLALMAHFTHPRELQTAAAQAALRRIQDSGAVVRCQAPLVRHVNDEADIWADLWRLEVRLGAVPYYMFVERDTGPKGYFEVPLARCYEIFQMAYRRVSGLERTVRGPSMSATPGKIIIDGITEIQGEKVFSLRFIQAREPDWVRRPFFAKFDEDATWIDQLQPAFGANKFFFERRLEEMKEASQSPAYGHRIVARRKPSIFGHVEWE
ncbi:MAG TPA: lysine 2,3-aminomutase [Opitutaceae bacterium]|nr:lysine 2,3-aminomutase [Opitutaceae bacterium]